jgi:hypothetical protein
MSAKEQYEKAKERDVKRLAERMGYRLARYEKPQYTLVVGDGPNQGSPVDIRPRSFVGSLEEIEQKLTYLQREYSQERRQEELQARRRIQLGPEQEFPF